MARSIGDSPATASAIEVVDLTMAYGDRVVMQKLSFEVRQGEIFVIMGGSGSGKSTLLKHLIGLRRAAKGRILFGGEDFSAADGASRRQILRRDQAIPGGDPAVP